jgi:ATP-dependent Lhr-like helicase
MTSGTGPSSFFRLHPALRHAIVHDLGWRDLRPVQEQAADAILDGCNVVVLAPTAGGKTEASIFPVLSRILTDETRPVAALYVCPIRALLNNQEERVRRYAQMVGLDAFKWHGDVSASAKARFVRDPRHLLMITPESLEVMMISQKSDARTLFAGLSAVIIDEVHAFAADDRGAHLVSVLERLSRFCGRDVQRIGLSATVGNPDEIGRWLQGSSERPYRRVDPPRPPSSRDFVVDRVEDDGAAARAAARLGEGKKSLVFVESRSGAERVAAAMSDRGVDVFVHHSAISRSDRELAEAQFAGGSNTAIVCTSTMELGIDVGDLDLVLQIDAPGTVASLLQRMGRTGRRPGTRSSCTFLCTTPESLVQATALVQLVERGWVEDVKPPRAAAHVLAHQIMALTLQEGGVSRHRLADWLGRAAPFEELSPVEVSSVVDTMLARDILHEADGLLSLGTAGERRYGRRNFFELYAVFDAPNVVRVLQGAQEVGVVQALFLRSVLSGSGGGCFRLGGRSWQVGDVDWNRATCQVTPAKSGRVPAWLGTPAWLSYAVCQEIKRVLADEAIPTWLTPAGAVELRDLRAGHEGLVDEGASPVVAEGDAVRWYTFAGGAANRLLALGLARVDGGEWTPGNWSIKAKNHGDAARVRDAVARLHELDWRAVALAEADADQFDDVSKFQPCLPEGLARKLVVERVFDVDTAGAIAAPHGRG